MRSRVPWWVVVVLFMGLPLLEIYLIVQLGQAVGPLWTILLLAATGVVGAMLVKREGRRAWRALQDALSSHRMPATELADGALILIGGTLLLTPGFVTDAVGLVCVLPFTRPVARRGLAAAITRRMRVVFDPAAAPHRPGPSAASPGNRGPGGPGGPASGGAGPGSTPQGGGQGNVVRGDVVDDSDR